MGAHLIKCTVTNKNHKTAYPFGTPLFQNGFEVDFDRNVTFLCGDNGVGKSTFLESLAGKIGFSPSGGGRDHVLHYQSFSSLMKALSAGAWEERSDWEIMRDNADADSKVDNLSLADNMRLVWRSRPADGFFFRAESYLLLTALSRYQCGNLSHGEGIVQLISGFRNGIFLLDEPESGLSPSLQLRLIFMIDRQVRDYDAQFIIATHSPVLMAYPGARLLQITPDELLPTTFDQTTHYQLTKRILADPVSFFKRYLPDEEKGGSD